MCVCVCVCVCVHTHILTNDREAQSRLSISGSPGFGDPPPPPPSGTDLRADEVMTVSVSLSRSLQEILERQFTPSKIYSLSTTSTGTKWCLLQNPYPVLPSPPSHVTADVGQRRIPERLSGLLP